MKKGMKRSETRKAGDPHCGCSGCDRKPEPNSWYCWKHHEEDLEGANPLPGLKSLSPLLAA